MAAFVGLHNRVYVGHLDLTGKSNMVNFGDLSRVMQNCTTFADAGYQCVSPGMISGALTVRGYQDFAADAFDDELSLGQLGSQYAATVIPNPTGTVAVGDTAWFSRGVVGSLNPLDGAKGDMGEFEFNLPYDTVIAQGKVLHPLAAETADGNGTALAMAGPTAAQKLYAALHVTAFTGLTSAVIKVQSDNASGMSSPTDRITFATVTGVTNEFASVAGSFSSETHLRTSLDATGTGSITFAVIVGVL